VSTLTADRNRPQKPVAPASILPRNWEEFSRLYPIYEALTQGCGLPSGPYPSGLKTNQWPAQRERDLRWLDEVEQHAQAVHLRHFLATPAAASEEGLRLLLQRHLGKPKKERADRDKIDLLTVQYFVLCAPQNLIEGRVDASAVANVLRPVLSDVKPARLDCCDALDRLLAAAEQSHRLRDLMEQGLFDQGRLVKEGLGEAFYQPAALIWICRFNFLMRRFFIQWLHADLRAIGAALKELEHRQIKFVDCRRAGLSAAEPLAVLRQFHERWRPPLQTDYSQDSAFHPYEQLMSLREDLEEALGLVTPPAAAPVSGPAKGAVREAEAKAEPPHTSESNAGQPPKAMPAKPASTAPTTKSSDRAAPARQSQAPASPASREASAVTNQAAPPADPLDVESLEEKIWEQLIASPPARGRSMTTVTVENAKILLSAWEVAAFISESGNDSQELRRVIVARAMLSTAIDRRKRLMDFRSLQQAIAHARGEVPRFQERIDQFKRTSKTDGAVNLGISLKRLLSLIEEAELLQKGNEGQPGKR
jgi:hypothetical protein